MPAEWADLQPGEPIGRLEHVAGGLWFGEASRGWPEFCRWASAHLPGQWVPKDRGATWSDGSRYLWFVERGTEGPILGAREVVLDLGLECGWSVGSAARSLLRYIGKAEYPWSSSRYLLDGAGVNYYDCRPGCYPDCLLWDVKSYYYDLWNRLPSLRPKVRRSGSILWGRQSAGEETRRAKVAGAVGCHKSLRNALWGCSLGRERGHVFYCRGERRPYRGAPGPFYGAALLVARTAWELTREAAEECGSVLSLVDCVCSPGGEYPSAWSSRGFTVELRASGAAEICAPVVYRVGGRSTAYYVRGSRFQDPIPRPPAPELQWSRLWVA